MSKFLTIYSWLFIVLMTVGETVVVLTTDKYWPLSIDDYIGMAVLAYAITFIKVERRYLWMIVCYAVMAGNVYAMLFTRLDPVFGSGERIIPLVILLLYLSMGLVFSLVAHHKINAAGYRR